MWKKIAKCLDCTISTPIHRLSHRCVKNVFGVQWRRDDWQRTTTKLPLLTHRGQGINSSLGDRRERQSLSFFISYFTPRFQNSGSVTNLKQALPNEYDSGNLKRSLKKQKKKGERQWNDEPGDGKLDECEARGRAGDERLARGETLKPVRVKTRLPHLPRGRRWAKQRGGEPKRDTQAFELDRCVGTRSKVRAHGCFFLYCNRS